MSGLLLPSCCRLQIKSATGIIAGGLGSLHPPPSLFATPGRGGGGNAVDSAAELIGSKRTASLKHGFNQATSISCQGINGVARRSPRLQRASRLLSCLPSAKRSRILGTARGPRHHPYGLREEDEGRAPEPSSLRQPCGRGMSPVPRLAPSGTGSGSSGGCAGWVLAALVFLVFRSNPRPSWGLKCPR